MRLSPNDPLVARATSAAVRPKSSELAAQLTRISQAPAADSLESWELANPEVASMLAPSSPAKRVYGFDPSLSHFGYAVAEESDAGVRFLVAGVLATKAWRKTKGERKPSKTDDNRRRFEALAGAMFTVIARHGAPAEIGVEALALPFGKTTLTVISALGRARGLVDCLAGLHTLEAREFQPQALKQLATGDRTASKAQVIEAIATRYPELRALFAQLDAANVEHAADACAAVHAVLTRRHLHEES